MAKMDPFFIGSQNRPQNGPPKWGPKRAQKGPQNGPKIGPPSKIDPDRIRIGDPPKNGIFIFGPPFFAMQSAPAKFRFFRKNHI